MSMKDLVSVIVPVYNVEQYLDKCVDSIVHQSYKKLEIILIDDGSKDSSGQLCDKWKQMDNRIKVIHKQNEGLGFARNSGLEIQNLAQFVHSLHLQTSCCICSPSQLQLVTDIINFPEADSPGHFKYLHADFIGSYINCRKGCHSHSSSSFPPTRVDYFFFSSSVPTI